MNSEKRSRLESRLAAAHRSTLFARNIAEQIDDHALYLDLTQILVTLTRLTENSLRGKARRQILGQTSLVDPPDNVPY